MNKSAFLELIQQVSNISDQQTKELEKVAAAFPYCQTAHLLLAKSAHDQGSMLSSQRLRRASAYATDRQLLKRLIYTSPGPAPAFAETATLTGPQAPPADGSEAPVLQVEVESHAGNLNDFQQIDAAAVSDEASQDEANTVAEAVTNNQSIEQASEAGVAGSAAALEELNLLDPASESITAELIASSENNTIDSELTMLLTINSLSSSFTDLLAQKPPVESIETEVQLQSGLPLSSLQETLDALQEFGADLLPEPAAAQLHAFVKPAPMAEAEILAAFSLPKEAGIIYRTDEIGRLYNEDALGYWMASSRMGEALQLKDACTRQRPQGFHPELILEYAKTHELEKADLPAAALPGGQHDIIDQFLKLNPRLKTLNNIKMRPEPQEDLSLRNSKIRKGIASESLANIFLQQGKVKKAIKIYEQLLLKNPEKKGYFAEQIEKLQNLT